LPVLDARDEFAGLPLLVDDGLHPNIMSSIEMINRNRRPVIRVRRWQPVHAGRLITVSAPGYEPYVPIGIKSIDPLPYVNLFSRVALQMLRASVAEAYGNGLSPGPRRIYLARSAQSNNLRQIENAGAIEDILQNQGIPLVMPESMTFAEQVAVCLEAELIVAPVGAALANMIFAPPGCRVVVLAPYYVGASYFYYANLAGVLGHKLTYLLGPQIGAMRHPRQRSYRIDVDDLRAALK
jgi:capsular polysaccharide biosynthesis protein